MYIKFIGAVVAVIASLMGGYSFYLSGKQEYSDLISCRLMLQLIRSELHSCPSELSIILSNVQGRLQSAAAGFVRALSDSLSELGESTFFELWERCVNEHLTMLKEEELNTVRDLGAVIGRYDAVQQVISIDAAIEKLMYFENERALQLESGKKLSIGLPGALGLMLVIVLF